MTTTRSAIVEDARRIVVQEIGVPVSIGRVASAAERISVRLYHHLGRWIGLDGCDVMVARALDEVRADWPWFARVRARPRRVPHLEGLEWNSVAPDPNEGTEAVIAFLVAFVEILGTAIGLELAQRLVQQAWQDQFPSSTVQESGPHDW